jgi:electron transfer flavoprotein beta subunit
VLDAGALGVDSVGQSAAKVRRIDYFVPVAGAGAEMIEGSNEEVATKIVDLLRAKGGIK